MANLWTAWFIRAFKGKECCVNWHRRCYQLCNENKDRRHVWSSQPRGIRRQRRGAELLSRLQCSRFGAPTGADVAPQDALGVEQEDRSATAPVRTCWSALPECLKSSILCEEPAPLKRSW